jgi:hypothetical protein
VKTIKISRANFPNTSMLYWATFFEHVLKDRYNVVVDAENPDIVFYSNLYSCPEHLDTYTNTNAKSHVDYDSSVKKVFCSGEDFGDHLAVIEQGSDYFAIGPTPLVEHERYLRYQIHNTTAAWGLYSESLLVDTPYDWLLKKRNGEDVLNSKKHFCGVVQNSTVPYRVELFEKLTNYKFVRASGAWITNVPPEEATIHHASIDGEGYKSKVNFLNSCKFSIQVQSSYTRYFTHEKMIQAYAANTIPIFYGNDKILEDGFNPKSFINCHDFKSVDDVVEYVKEIDQNDSLFKEMIEEPVFIDNKLPYYFEHDYFNNFIERVLKDK